MQLTPTVTVYGCTAQLTQWDVFSGAAAGSPATVPCGATMRTVIYGSTVSTQIDGEIYTSQTSNTGGGQPGFGLGSNPSGNSVSQVQFGLRTLTVPYTIVENTIAADPFSTHIDIRWIEPGDPTGVGLPNTRFGAECMAGRRRTMPPCRRVEPTPIRL